MTDTKRRVLVTGSSRGIGRAIARALKAAGFTVVCQYGSKDEDAHETLQELGLCADDSLLKFDVADQPRAEAALAAHIETHGAFWGVVLNAGIRRDATLAGMDLTDWRAVIDTNLNAYFHVMKPIIQPMIRLKDGGRVVGVSSLSSRAGLAGQANYAASKAGLEAALRSLGSELAGRRITVNSILPGFIDTDMLRGLNVDDLVGRVPMKRLGTATEVAELVRFLFSDSAGYITKQAICIDGGIA